MVGAYIEALRQPKGVDERNQELRLRAKLQAHALPEIYVNVLVCRYVYCWTYAEIAEFLHIPDRQQAHYMHKKSLELLKERAYGKRKKK